MQTPAERELLKTVKEASLSYRDISDIVIRDVQEGNLETAAKIAAEGEIYEGIVNEMLRELIEYQAIQHAQTEKELQDGLA